MLTNYKRLCIVSYGWCYLLTISCSHSEEYIKEADFIICIFFILSEFYYYSSDLFSVFSVSLSLDSPFSVSLGNSSSLLFVGVLSSDFSVGVVWVLSSGVSLVDSVVFCASSFDSESVVSSFDWEGVVYFSLDSVDSEGVSLGVVVSVLSVGVLDSSDGVVSVLSDGYVVSLDSVEGDSFSFGEDSVVSVGDSVFSVEVSVGCSAGVSSYDGVVSVVSDGVFSLFSSGTGVSVFSSDVGVSVLVSSEVGVSVFSDFSLCSSLGVVSVFSDFSLFSSEGVVSVFSECSDYSSWDSCSSFDAGVSWLSSVGFSVFSECSSDYVGVSSCFDSSCSAFSVGLLCSPSVSVGT